MNIIYIEIAAGLVATGVAAPFIINVRTKSSSPENTGIRSVRPQFDNDDMREPAPIITEKAKKIKEKKAETKKKSNGIFGFGKSKNNDKAVIPEAQESDLDDLSYVPKKETKVSPIKDSKSKQKKSGFSIFGIGKKKNNEVSTGLDNDEILAIVETEEIFTEKNTTKDQIERTVEREEELPEEDDLILLSTSSEIERTNDRTVKNDEKFIIPVLENQYVSEIHEPIALLPDPQIESEEELGGFGLNRTDDENERRQWIAELVEEDIKNTTHIQNPDNIQEVEEDNIYSEFKEEDSLNSSEKINAEEIKKSSKTSVKERTEPQAEISKSYKWTTFMGNDAQSLGAAERTNLIMLLRNMKDPSHLDILIAALQEEDRDGLRPKALEAIIHSYHDASLAEIYEYCVEFGNDDEKLMAQNALDEIGVA